MHVENARKKLLKAAGYVETYLTGYRARIGNYEVSFLRANSGDLSPEAAITCEHVRRVLPRRDDDELQSDYFGGSYCDSLTQAIRWAQTWTAKDTASPTGVH